MKITNEKINKEIKKTKDFIKEWQGILLVVLIIAAFIFLIGLRVYLNKSGETEKMNTERNCHYEAIKKAQEKYKNEISESPRCLYCGEEEDEESYRKEDYKEYYQECLNENIK